jgi:hypothetical protein
MITGNVKRQGTLFSLEDWLFKPHHVGRKHDMPVRVVERKSPRPKYDPPFGRGQQLIDSGTGEPLDPARAYPQQWLADWGDEPTTHIFDVASQLSGDYRDAVFNGHPDTRLAWSHFRLRPQDY